MNSVLMGTGVGARASMEDHENSDNQGKKVVSGKHFNLYVSIAVPISLLAAAICFLGCRREELAFFWLLPFCYAIGLIVSFRKQNTTSLGYSIIHCTMLIRYVFATFLTVTNETYLGYFVRLSNYTHILMLMLYEMLVVFAVMMIYGRSHRTEAIVLFNAQNTAGKNGIVMRAFIVFVVLSTIVTVLLFSSARNSLLNFSISVNKTSIETENLSGFVFVFFNIGINVIYALLIHAITGKSGRGNAPFLLCCVVSVLFISSNWTNGANVSRWGLLTSALVCYFVLIKAFPKRKSTLLIVGGVGFVGILVASSIAKLSLHHGVQGYAAFQELLTSESFNEYFQGIYPVANGIEAMKAYAGRINFVTFLDDTISAYPWVNKLFYDGNNFTQRFYMSFIGRQDKILATIVQGYAYLGYIGAPLFSGLMTFLALKCDTIMRRTANIYIAVAITQIAVWCALFMAVNVYIIQRTTMCFVLLLFVMRIDKYLVARRR